MVVEENAELPRDLVDELFFERVDRHRVARDGMFRMLDLKLLLEDLRDMAGAAFFAAAAGGPGVGDAGRVSAVQVRAVRLLDAVAAELDVDDVVGLRELAGEHSGVRLAGLAIDDSHDV